MNFECRLNLHADEMKKNIEPPFEIGEIIKNEEEISMKKTNKNHLRNISLSVAGTAAAFILVFNCSPRLARAAEDIPVLGKAVKIVTFGRFEFHENGFEANIVTPKIEGLSDKELEDRLNSEFKENADLVISAFEKDVAELKAEFGDEETIHMGVDANYTVRTDNDDILAIDCYILNVAGSSMTRHSFYNINKKTGELIGLASLFRENSDYITPISDVIITEMRKQNADGSGYFWVDDDTFENFEKIKPEQNFFINADNEIVICFDKYEVAAGAQGCPEFVIPNEILKDILKK